MVINQKSDDSEPENNKCMKQQREGRALRPYTDISAHNCVLVAGVAVPYLSLEGRNLKIPTDLPPYLTKFLGSVQGDCVPFTCKGATSTVRLLNIGISNEAVSYEVHYER